MGISEKMSHIASNMKEGVRTTSYNLATFLLRLVTGSVLGLTIALVVQELTKTGNLVFVFVLLIVGGLFMKLSSKWGLGQILIFDLIAVLIAQLLRMYIYLAP